MMETPISRRADDGDEFARLQHGDVRALEELFRRHRRVVYVAALGVLGSRADAEEILQDAFVTLWSKRRSIEIVGSSVAPWLITTARFLALNRLRAGHRRRLADLDELDALPSAANGPLGEAVRAELAADLAAAIAALDPIDRQIVDLCLAEGLAYKQAATALGVSHATVRNRLSRIRANLRVRLSDRKGSTAHEDE